VLASACLFSVLLNFKHIYLYVAPIYFVYILGAYVKFNPIKLAKVAIVTVMPFILSFLPFVLAGGPQQIGIILARLFPFQRGLVHSYWAPNFWAFYYFADRVLAGLGFKQTPIGDMGYSSTLKVLPNISAGMTLVIIMAVSLPMYISCYLKSRTI
jgi:alpha-1,3-glucosyltransferase